MIKVGAVSGDLVVKLALAGLAIGALWYLWSRLNVGEAARRAGNAAVDTTVVNPLHAVAAGTGSALIGAVDAVPGLTDYLKRISSSDVTPGTSDIGPGTTEVDGQTYTFGY